MPHGKKSKQNRNYTAISIKANHDPHKKLKKKKPHQDNQYEQCFKHKTWQRDSIIKLKKIDDHETHSKKNTDGKGE